MLPAIRTRQNRIFSIAYLLSNRYASFQSVIRGLNEYLDITGYTRSGKCESKFTLQLISYYDEFDVR